MGTQYDLALPRKPLSGVLHSRGTYLLVRLVLAGVFVFAGAQKLMDPAAFAQVVAGYGLLPGPLVAPVAVALPLLEVAAGLGLVLDLRGSLGAVLGMTLLFLLVLAWGMALGLDIDCGCYGPGDPEAHAYGGLREAFARDVGLLAMIGYAAWWRRATGLWPRAGRSGHTTTNEG